jgi:hypothetical protein
MMAMTIFMGSTPAWAPSLRLQVVGSLRCASTRAGDRDTANAATTNQAACQFAPLRISDWKQKAIVEVPGACCDLLSAAAQGPTSSAQFLIKARQRIECLFAGHWELASGASGSAMAEAAGTRGGGNSCLLQRFSMLGQVEPFDLVLLAHS